MRALNITRASCVTVLAGCVKENCRPQPAQWCRRARSTAGWRAKLVGTAGDKRPCRARLFVSIPVDNIREINWQGFLGKEMSEDSTLSRSCRADRSTLAAPEWKRNYPENRAHDLFAIHGKNSFAALATTASHLKWKASDRLLMFRVHCQREYLSAPRSALCAVEYRPHKFAKRRGAAHRSWKAWPQA